MKLNTTACVFFALSSLGVLSSCSNGRGVPPPPPPPACTNTATIACTKSGALQGLVEGSIRAFRGIPYAAPPVGNLRWRPPAPPLSWTGTRDASAFGNICTQINYGRQLVGTEDCLFLNVFTSSPAPSSKQPVMVFFHGGGNEAGDTHSAPYDSPTLESHGVVVVTAEYRLGVLGFLANPLLTTERPGSSGDYALLDMIAALNWVKQNIANFGGDASHVMLFGQSAGSFNIQMLLAAPAAAGTFSAAGMESNVIPTASTAPWVPTLAVAESASAPFVDAMGCGGAADVFACMRAVPADTLVNAYFQSQFALGPGLGSTFLPVDSAVFLQQHGSPVPLLIGSTREEWTGVTDRPIVTLTESQYEAALHTRFDPIGPSVASHLLSLYPATDYDTPEYALIAVDSDYNMTCEVRNVARAAAGTGKSPVWRYFFTHAMENDPNLNSLRSFHTIELYFVFGNLASLVSPPYTPNADEVTLSDQLIGYWTRFAATGDPNGGGATVWPPYDPNTDSMLQLDTTQVAINGYHDSQCDYLSTLPQP